jgi:hypothetical protein
MDNAEIAGTPLTELNEKYYSLFEDMGFTLEVLI